MDNRHHVLHYVKNITDYVEKQANSLLKAQDLTLAQGQILRCLKQEKNGKCPLKELEKELKVAQSTSAGLVSRLEKKNFIKTYHDEHDKRIKIVEITQEGIMAMQYIRQSFEQVEKDVFNGLTDIEKMVFLDLTQKIINNISPDSSPDCKH